jgi:hypothetical protein
MTDQKGQPIGHRELQAFILDNSQVALSQLRASLKNGNRGTIIGFFVAKAANENFQGVTERDIIAAINLKENQEVA